MKNPNVLLMIISQTHLYINYASCGTGTLFQKGKGEAEAHIKGIDVTFGAY